MHTHVVAHLVHRGMGHLAARQQDIEPMPHEGDDNNLGDGIDFQAAKLWPVMVTLIIGSLVLYLLSYSWGQLMSTLTVIESPSGHRTDEPIPPPQYTDDSTDEPLLQAEAEHAPRDIETDFVVHKPITSRVRTTMAHLSRIGGFRARFRGLGFGLAYSIVFSLLTQLASFGMGTIGTAVATICTSLLLARLHMFWTHSMIAAPQSRKWRSLPKLRDCKPLILPALVYAIAQEAGVIPFVVANALGVINTDSPEAGGAFIQTDGHHATALAGLSVFAIIAVFAAVSLFIIIPASITLTRIEAFLLPDGDETIVPFDKAAIAGAIILGAPGSSRSLFWRAWQTFTHDGWVRLFKLYAKLIAAEVLIIIVMAILIVAEIAIFG